MGYWTALFALFFLPSLPLSFSPTGVFPLLLSYWRLPRFSTNHFEVGSAGRKTRRAAVVLGAAAAIGVAAGKHAVEQGGGEAPDSFLSLV